MLTFPNHNLLKIAQVIGKRRGHPPDASCIEPRLYLTDYHNAVDPKELSRLAVTHVISILDHDVPLPDFIKDENKLHIRVQDHAGVKLMDYFDKTTEFIHSALEESPNNVVLVHCLMGISRSATIVCAYLIRTKRMKAGEAVEYVQTKRPIVCPNLGFRNQLEKYATRFEPHHKWRNSELIVTKIKGMGFRTA